MQLTSQYRSFLVSADTLDIEDLSYRCINFMQTQPVHCDLDEMLIYLNNCMLDNVYVDADKRHRRQKNILFGDVFRMLESMAPKGCFFGMHPGDPGRLGFWKKSLRYG